jgi:hypothetical protein
MTTKRSEKMTSNLARLFSALCTASLAAAGCGDDNNGPPIPVDNSAVVAGKQAYVKFCHQLKRDGKPIVLTVEFGVPALAKISAVTGTCSPPINVPCAAIPVGVYPGRLLEGTTLLAPGTFRISEGAEYLLWAEVSGYSGKPIVAVDPTYGVFETGQCSRFDPLASDAGVASDAGSLPPSEAADAADGGAPQTGPDAGPDSDLDAAAD